MAAVDEGDLVTPELAWRQFPGSEHYSDKEWTTYQGCWTIFNGAGTGTDDVFRQYNAIRCFRLSGTDERQLLHKNLIAINMGMGNPVQRPDGFWESNMSYRVDEPSRSCSTRLQPGEDGVQPYKTRRLTIATPNAYVSSPAALPLGGADEAGGGGANPEDASGPSRSILPGGVWATEAFFEDGVYRWSMGTVYELPSRRLRQTFLIREYNVPVDPAASLDPRKLPIPDARPGVGDPAAAADATAGKACTAVEVRYGADGQLRKLPQGSTAKELDDASGTRLVQYPDGMYARIPEQLSEAGSSGSRDITFTWGGPMRGALAYQEQQLTYAADTGSLTSLRTLAWR